MLSILHKAKLQLTKIWVPTSNVLVEQEVPQTWAVRWYSRNGNYSSDVKPEIQSFLSAEAAQHFADALSNAHKLLRNTNYIDISIEKSG